MLRSSSQKLLCIAIDFIFEMSSLNILWPCFGLRWPFTWPPIGPKFKSYSDTIKKFFICFFLTFCFLKCTFLWMEMDAAAPSEFLTAFSKERRSYTKAGLQKDNLCVVAKKASASHILFNWVETRNNSTVITIVKTILFQRFST